MVATNHGGYTESEQRIKERWSRLTFEAAKIETCLRQTTEEEADRLHELIVTCDTDPAHILNTEQEPSWNDGISSDAWYNSQKEVPF